MESAPPLLVIADPIHESATGLLRGAPCRVVDASAGPDRLATELPDAWGLVVRSRTKVTRELLERAPKLRFIARAGVGVDNIDMEAATRRGIRVANAPTAATTSVAELTVAFMLLLVRDLYGPISTTKAGRFDRGVHGHELGGRTVGLVGYGRIAREVAARLRPFGVTILAHDPFLAASPDGTPLLALDELLAKSQILSLHAAAGPENEHMIDGARLARLPRGAYLVNVARGSLVDEAALVDALASGHLAGAALDVFETEPPTRTALLSNPHVLPTPHLGASTPEAQARAGMLVVEETLRALRHEPLRFQVNPEVPAT